MTMPELEHDPDAESNRETDSEAPGVDEPGPTVVDLPTGAGSARVRLPADADADEVAALVSVVAARLREDDEAEAPETAEADPWCLAGRVGARRRHELPRECRRGGAWKAASRCP